MNSTYYRPEIDGLRAVAVLSVLFFHLGMGFPGGFIGVDVFFVISGFLITGIIKRQLEEDRFSCLDFFSRRVRRILPAASVLVLVSCWVGYEMLSAKALIDLAATVQAQALVYANVFFAQQDGYFTESADHQALLHTWSLAVEEQFYLIFPFVFLLLYKFWRKSTVWVFILIALGSFYLSQSMIDGSEKKAFFLLYSRAWELLAGSLLAIVNVPSLQKKWAELLSGLSMIALAFGFFWYDKLTPFPGVAALLPVLATVAFIYSNKSEQTGTGRLLSLKPIVFIGLISYSLYLWHWPVIVFAKLTVVELQMWQKWILVAVSFGLAIVSWKWIETPFRSGKLLKTHPRAITYAVVSILAFVGIALFLKSKSDVSERFSEDQLVWLEDIDWAGEEYLLDHDKPVFIGELSKEKVDFAVWGDSHALVACAAVSRAAEKKGLKGIVYATSGVPPCPDVWYFDSTRQEIKEMQEAYKTILSDIGERKIAHVFLIGRWMARCDGYNVAEMVDEKPEYKLSPMLVDSFQEIPTEETAAETLTNALRKVSQELTDLGSKVWIMHQVPESVDKLSAQLFYQYTRYPMFNQLDAYTTTREEHHKRQKNAKRAIDQILGEQLHQLDPGRMFFLENERLKIYEDRSFYRDDDHLTRAGAYYYLQPFFEEVFSKLE